MYKRNKIITGLFLCIAVLSLACYLWAASQSMFGYYVIVIGSFQHNRCTGDFVCPPGIIHTLAIVAYANPENPPQVITGQLTIKDINQNIKAFDFKIDRPNVFHTISDPRYSWYSIPVLLSGTSEWNLVEDAHYDVSVISPEISSNAVVLFQTLTRKRDADTHRYKLQCFHSGRISPP